MKTLKVPAMMCANCVKRISTALENAGIDANVDLATKTVTVAADKADAVIEILDDLGFDVQ